MVSGGKSSPHNEIMKVLFLTVTGFELCLEKSLNRNQS